jgi:hypothetical protein
MRITKKKKKKKQKVVKCVAKVAAVKPLMQSKPAYERYARTHLTITINKNKKQKPAESQSGRGRRCFRRAADEYTPNLDTRGLEDFALFL